MSVIEDWKENRRSVAVVNLTVILVVLAILALSYPVLYFATNKAGAMITVEKDGAVIGSYGLDDDRQIPISDDAGSNLLVIEGGKAHMEEASCPDHLCIKQGEISKVGQTIVCLPNKVIVTVVSGDEADVDAVVK